MHHDRVSDQLACVHCTRTGGICMRRKWRVVLAAAMFFVMAATPALAADGEPAIDINDFLPSDR